MKIGHYTITIDRASITIRDVRKPYEAFGVCWLIRKRIIWPADFHLFITPNGVRTVINGAYA